MATLHRPHRRAYDPATHPELIGTKPDVRTRLIPLLGVVFVVLLGVSIGLNAPSPSSDATGLTVIQYYTAHEGRANSSALLTALSIPAGLFFFVLLREYLHRLHRFGSTRTFTTVALAGAVVFAVGGCISAGLTFSLADVPDRLTIGAAKALNVLSSDLGAGLLIGGLSTMQFGFGIAFLTGHAFPPWLGWLTIAIGIVSLLGPLAFVGLLATGVWVLIVSAMIYMKPAVTASS